MPTPVDGIAADAASTAMQVAASPLSSGISERLRKLIQPSPRTLEVLSTDLVATLVNGFVQGGPEAQLGESVADCVYAIAGTDGGIGGESPIMRLLRSVVRLFMGRRKAQASMQPTFGVPSQ